jgi:hypothetical protein
MKLKSNQPKATEVLIPFLRVPEVETLCSHGKFLLRCKSTQSHIGTVIVLLTCPLPAVPK